MKSLYEVNGLIHFQPEWISIRSFLEDFFANRIISILYEINPAWKMIRVQAPILTPRHLINPDYTDSDIFSMGDLVLRPETTMGSYKYAKFLLASHSAKLPLVVWQSGISFRREQDHTLKQVRLKEFHQQEFQCIYSPSTKNNYQLAIIPLLKQAFQIILKCQIECQESDRLPSYSEKTIDFMARGMEICSCSLRKDYEDAQVVEIAIGLDRCVYQFYGDEFGN